MAGDNHHGAGDISRAKIELYRPALNMELPMHRMKYVRRRESDVALTRIHGKRLRLPKRARNKKPNLQNSVTYRRSFQNSVFITFSLDNGWSAPGISVIFKGLSSIS